MLDKKIFLKGLKYLNDYYNNFKFEINNNVKIGVWYSVFQDFSDENFTQLIKLYCKENIYAPQSPTHLLEHAKSLIKRTALSNEDAWKYALSLLRHVGYDFSRFYSKCEYEVISSSIKPLELDLEGIHTDRLPFVKKQFVEIYEKKLNTELSENVLKGKIYVKELANKEQKVLEYKGEENELE